MRPSIAIILSLWLTASIGGEPVVVRPSTPLSECKQHLPYGPPKSAREDTTSICREGYALEHDNKAKIPAWVAYTLTPENALGCHPRTKSFRQDPSVRADASATLKDYAKSGRDIGHMANNSDMRWSRQVELESNVLSNAAPQVPGLNRGAWRTLEDQTRAWATQRNNNLLIYVGPVYEKLAPTTIGKGHVTVPLSFYKIIIDQKSSEMLAFLYPNQDTSHPPSTFQTSVPMIQQLTGIVFPVPQRPVFSTGVWPSSTKSARYEKVRTCIIAQKP